VSESSAAAIAERLVARVLAQLRSRVELIAVEWQEEKIRLGRSLTWLMLTVFFLQLAVVMAVLWVVVTWWDTPSRAGVIAGVALGAVGAAGFGFYSFRRRLQSRPRLFAATVAELRKDEEALHSGEAT
jgi:uncharacterized membrane protein YqjE